MPRKAGGTRVGAPGRAYPNRTDLNANKNLPARAATNQTYGQAGQQLQAQQTVPMAPQPVPLPPPGMTPPGLGAPGGAPTPGGPMGGPPPGPPPFAPTAPPPAMPPGAMGPLSRPTENPNEPVTSGLPIGAGPGPEALAPSPVAPVGGVGSMSAMLAQAAQASGSATLQSLLQRAQAAGM